MHTVKIKCGSCSICGKQSTCRTGGNDLTKTPAETIVQTGAADLESPVYHKVIHMFLALFKLITSPLNA